MTTGYKILAAVVLLISIAGGSIAWWTHHDSKEQTIGAKECVAATTETKQEAIASNVITAADHAAQLKAVVDAYEKKVSDLAASNGDLAQRLHDAHNAVRPGAMPAVAGSAQGIRAAADDAGPSDCDRREAVNLEACAANTIELNSIRAAWQKLAQKKGAGDPTP